MLTKVLISQILSSLPWNLTNPNGADYLDQDGTIKNGQKIKNERNPQFLCLWWLQGK